MELTTKYDFKWLFICLLHLLFHTSLAISIGGNIKRDYPCSSFITKLSIVNVVGASFKHKEQLNHIGTLQWVGVDGYISTIYFCDKVKGTIHISKNKQ